MKYRMVSLGNLIEKTENVRCGDHQYPVLSMTMHEGLVFQDNKFKKIIASKDKSDYKVVYRNQLVIGFPIDEGVLAAQRVTDIGIVSPAYTIWSINQGQIIPEFLEYALRCEKSIHYYKAKLRGSTARRRSLPTPTLLEHTIPVPDKAEQERILNIIHNVKNVIAYRKEEIKALDNLIKARFIELFGDLKSNSKGWPIVGFNECAEIDTNMIHDFEGYEDYPHIGIDSIEKETGRLSGYRTVAEDGVISGKYLFTEKHIIYSKIRPNLNKVAMPDFVGVCSADAYPILVKDDICVKEYLGYTMRSKYFLDYILAFSNRTNLPKVNKKQVEGFALPLPPMELQQQFAAFVSQLDKSKVVA